MSNYQYSLNEHVRIEVSGEAGLIIARAEYLYNENNYLIRYKSSDGSANESWWVESALSSQAD